MVVESNNEEHGRVNDMRYYVVRALWAGEDQSTDFVERGVWINGYGEDRYSLTVNMIKSGDILILARPNQEIFNIGLCEKNENDFETIRVKWFGNFNPVKVGNSINPYMRTINRLRSDDFYEGIKADIFKSNPGLEVFLSEEDLIEQPELIRIEKIRLAWFKFFGKEWEFDISGKNMLLYGENGSGKTSLSDAIRFVAQTSIIDGKIPVGDYSNIFSGENDDFLVEIQLSGQESYLIDETTEARDIGQHKILQNIAFINPFITYKDILQIYFREIEQKGTRNLFDFFRVILKDYPVDSGSGMKRLGDLSGKDYFDELTKLVKGLKDLANQFLEEFNENIQIGGFHTDSYERSITLDLNYRGQQVSEYQTFLNEAKLTALGLSVFFAAIVRKYTVYDMECKILVLDDLLVSLDMSHRAAILDIITKDHFENYQKIILTHERGFFNLFKSQLKKEDWVFYEMYEKEDPERNCSFPYLVPSLDFLEKAEKALNAKNFDSSANFLRKAVEEIAIEFTGKSTKRNGKPLSLQDLFNDIKGKINSSQYYSDRFKSDMNNIVSKIIHFRDAILNPFSHADKESPLYKKELEEALVLIKGFKKAIERL